MDGVGYVLLDLLFRLLFAGWGCVYTVCHVCCVLRRHGRGQKKRGLLLLSSFSHLRRPSRFEGSLTVVYSIYIVPSLLRFLTRCQFYRVCLNRTRRQMSPRFSIIWRPRI